MLSMGIREGHRRSFAVRRRRGTPALERDAAVTLEPQRDSSVTLGSEAARLAAVLGGHLEQSRDRRRIQ